MKRSAAVAVLVVIALAVGVAVGLLSASDTTHASAGSDLNVVSTWSGRPWAHAPATVKLETGALQGDPGHGFVLVETSGQKPAFFAAPAVTGAFRVVAHTDSDWELRSTNGSLLIVDPIRPDGPSSPTFTFLGRALEPAHLGKLGKTGVAVPVSYGKWSVKLGRSADSAVVLVSRTTQYPGWKLEGYLPGYSIPRPSPLQPELRRPLVGPDGRAYSVDATRGRLVLDSAWRSATSPGSAPMYKLGVCRSWPAGNDAYRTCPNSITFDHAGASTTLFQRELGRQAMDWSWYFLRPSPNGKWLLLEDAMGACGTATWADFLPAGGGALQPAFPGAFTSEAFGWLPDNSALIAAHTDDGCGGGVSGIYDVWPGQAHAPDPNFGTGSELVFPGGVYDATTWGFTRG